MTESIPRHINDVMTACRGSGSQCHAQIVNYACALCKYNGDIGPVSRGVSTVNVRIPSDAEAASISDSNHFPDSQKSPFQNGWHFPDSQKSPFQNGWHFPDSQKSPFQNGWHFPDSQKSPFQNGWHFPDSQKSPFQNGWHPELMPSGMGCKTSKEKCFMREWHPALARSGSSFSAPIIFLDEDLMF